MDNETDNNVGMFKVVRGVLKDLIVQEIASKDKIASTNDLVTQLARHISVANIGADQLEKLVTDLKNIASITNRDIVKLDAASLDTKINNLPDNLKTLLVKKYDVDKIIQIINRTEGSLLDKEIVECRNEIGGEISKKTPKILRYSMIGIVSILFVAMAVLLVISLFKFMKARQMGDLAKSQCGKEYMERETQRYYIYKEYRNIKYQLAIINVLLLTCMFVIFAYVAIQSFFIFSVVWKLYNVVENKGIQSKPFVKFFIRNGWKGLYWWFTIFFVAAVISTYIGSSTTWRENKQLKHETRMSNKQFNQVFKPFLVFVFVYLFVLWIWYKALSLKTNIIYMIMFMFLLYGAVALFTKKFTGFHNDVIVPYSKYANELNGYLSGLVDKTDQMSKKVKEYLSNSIRRSDTSVGVPEITKYKDEYYSYAIHNDGGNETFNSGGTTTSITLATFKKNIVTLFNANNIENDAKNFNTQLSEIKYPDGNVTYTNYATGHFNILIREQLVRILYTKDQEARSVIMGNVVSAVINNYADTAFGAGAKNLVKESFKSDTEYLLFDDEYQYMRAGDFGQTTVLRILNEAHHKGSIIKQSSVDDIMNILLLEMNQFDNTSINLKTILGKVEEIRDTYSFENAVSFYNVMDKLYDVITSYMNKNVSDTNLESKLSNMRSVDGPMKENMAGMIKFMFILTSTLFITGLFLIFHKLYHHEVFHDHIALWLPLSIILLIICVSLYSWITGNMKI